MRAFTVLLFSILVMAACSEHQEIPPAFVGTWQSDETLTLASLAESQTVSESDREIFEDDFFGDRVMEFQIDRLRSSWVGEEWAEIEQDDTWHGYDVVALGPDFMTLRSPLEETTWRIEGEYIYAELPKWGFREYYRRIGD